MKHTFLLLATGLLFAACKKEIDTLPEPTQTGANTFGAKVNGENWTPLKAPLLLTAPLLEARFLADSSLVINARNFSQTPRESELEIYLRSPRGTGTFPLQQTTEPYPDASASYAWFVKRKVTVEDEWMTGTAGEGEVQLTKLDWPARIVSGTFRFTATARRGSAPITVTEGRFDLKIQ